MHRLLVLILTLAACGTDKGGSSGDEPQQTAAPAAAPSSSSIDRHSLYVADAAALPTCDAAGEGWLVYVKADATFMVCSAGAWGAVDIQGPKGEAGPQGEKGEAGDAASVNAEWTNPVSGLTWSLGSLGSDFDESVCDGGRRLPTIAELSNSNGVLKDFFDRELMEAPATGRPRCAWAAQAGEPFSLQFPGSNNCPAESADDPKLIFCVAE
jgi:hypothetical protein